MIRLIFEDIEAVKKYYPNIDDNTFMELISLDPTYRGKDSLGKYGKWILNLYNKGNLSDAELSEVTPLLQQFTTYRNRIQNKDLNSYKSLQDLSDILASIIDDDSMLTDRQKVRFLKNVKAGRVKTGAEDDYDIVLDTPNYIVYVPNTHEASMKLGKGTKWCTAHENPEHYNKYTYDNGKLYIIKNKKTGERWQYSDKHEQFLNQNNKEFNIKELMLTDKELSKFFEQFIGIDYYSFDGHYVYTGGRVQNDLKNIITSVTVKKGVQKIISGSFMDCKNLREVYITNGVETIEKGAFFMCNSLIYVTIPNSVTLIEGGVFYGCDDLIVYTDNKYAIDYCKDCNIPVKQTKEFKNESIRKPFKLRIRE